MAKLLVIGSGGREHALSWKLAQSSSVHECFMSPGNASLHLADGLLKNTKLKKTQDFPGLSSFAEVAEWCVANKITLVCVGPEDPLSKGIVDVLTKYGVCCFGPTKAAAEIESSKIYAKNLMKKYGIPTASWKSFYDVQDAVSHIQRSRVAEQL